MQNKLYFLYFVSSHRKCAIVNFHLNNIIAKTQCAQIKGKKKQMQKLKQDNERFY